MSPSSPLPSNLSITPLLLTPPKPPHDSLKTRLEDLLRLLPGYVDRAARAAASTPANARRLFTDEGPLPLLRFWRAHSPNLQKAADSVLDAAEAAARGDTSAFRRAASRFDLRFLRRASHDPHPSQPEETTESPLPPLPLSLLADPSRSFRKLAVSARDSLTPWDFDRHDFGLTFAHVWVDVDALPSVEGGGPPPLVKLASTIKPLEREWKLTARAKLAEFGDGGVVFGKAGIYLAGEVPAYVGVEVDRVWRVPRLARTAVFANGNYRSSRKPGRDPVKFTLGVQQDFVVVEGLQVTLRIGVDPLEREAFFVTPVPNGEYF